ncbi:MAG: SdiA-regulated domain-containing protein [Saprospiraceae bacterium]
MQKLPNLPFGLALPILFLCFCNTKQPVAPLRPESTTPTDSLPYDLQNPSLSINLENEALQEISGLSSTDAAGVFIAIADERGEIFYIDGNAGWAVSRRVVFRDKGDFESVEMVGESIWAAKSDGDLFELTDLKINPPKMEEHKTFLKKQNDVEGLAYDPRRKSLFLACKENPDSLGPRNVYGFSLETKVLSESPAYTISPEEVNKLVPYEASEKRDYFSPSGIAFHPITSDLYVISTALKRLVVLDYKTGKIKFARRLDKKIFPQPEGVSFDQKGNILISNEGKSSKGLLLKFDFKQKN